MILEAAERIEIEDVLAHDHAPGTGVSVGHSIEGRTDTTSRIVCRWEHATPAVVGLVREHAGLHMHTPFALQVPGVATTYQVLYQRPPMVAWRQATAQVTVELLTVSATD